ncbi:MAG: outer membrane lipoprotein-sorting protein [Bdellovibrionales bacterium]|nr:outer membrane lipoprotein-sorting protein [Bdellovibrionales bacterium]
MKKLIILALLSFPHIADSNNEKNSAEVLIRKAEDNLRGTSQEGRVVMEIYSQDSKRTIKFDYWTKDRNKALIKILEPLKESGSGNLRIDLNVWRYLANTDRVIKVPPSMMLQSWMGSDFTYDDLVKVSSLSEDYVYKTLSANASVVKIECLPKPSAPVVWGKIIETIRIDGAVTLEREFYNEKGEKLKTMTGENIRKVGTHQVPHLLTMINHKKQNTKTIIKYTRIQYDKEVSDSFFSQKSLKEKSF